MTNKKIKQFQGTSDAGDFQSALQEAVNQALQALSVDVADQRISWKLIEVSGINGGFIGENKITVTIEAEPG